MDPGLTVSVIDAVAIIGIGAYLNNKIDNISKELETVNVEANSGGNKKLEKRIKKIEDDISKITISLNSLILTLKSKNIITNVLNTSQKEEDTEDEDSCDEEDLFERALQSLK